MGKIVSRPVGAGVPVVGWSLVGGVVGTLMSSIGTTHRCCGSGSVDGLSSESNLLE